MKICVNGEFAEIGANGATFIPSVSEAGVISWTNNGGLENPEPVSINGPVGQDGVGVPTGGTAGKVLGKASNTDYDTAWIDPPAVETYTTADGWYVRKHSDGYVEMIWTATKSINTSDWTTGDNNTRCSFLFNDFMTLPVPLVKKHIDLLNLLHTTKYSMTSMEADTNSTSNTVCARHYIFRPHPAPTVTISVSGSVLVTGLWKN